MGGFYILRIRGARRCAFELFPRRVDMLVWSGVSGGLASGVHYAKVKEALVPKEPSGHACLFGSARRIEIRGRRSAAEIDGQGNRRSAERCRFFASVEACGRCHLA